MSSNWEDCTGPKEGGWPTEDKEGSKEGGRTGGGQIETTPLCTLTIGFGMKLITEV